MATSKKASRLENLARFFRSREPAGTGGENAARRAALLGSPRRFASAQALVGAFYAVLFFFAAGNLFTWHESLAATAVEPRWPIFWLRFVDVETGIWLILWGHLLGALCGITLGRHRWARIAVFVTLLEFLALRFSYGSINHGDHLGLLLSFVLIFLPAGWLGFPAAPRRVRAMTMLTFAGCQAMILLVYSMSGLWKVGGVVEQLLEGEVSYLSPQGLGQQVAAKLLSDDRPSLLGAFVVEHYWLGWPLMIAALYLEFAALWVVARPNLHQAWGLGLILLHLSTHLTMGVGFPQNALWMALFLLLSPFRPQKLCWRQALRDLPGAGLVRRSQL